MRPNLVAATALSGLAALHALWATGSPWPLRSRAEYTEIVTGNGEFPSPRACLVVAVLLGTGAVFVSGRPRALPGLQRAGTVGATAVLATRGALGVAGRTDVVSRGSSSPRFRSIDRRLYSPLCLALAALAAPAAARRQRNGQQP